MTQFATRLQFVRAKSIPLIAADEQASSTYHLGNGSSCLAFGPTRAVGFQGRKASAAIERVRDRHSPAGALSWRRPGD